MFTWQTKIIAALVVAAGVFYAGWSTRDAFCDSAAAKEQVRLLREQVATLEERAKVTADAAEEDRKRAEADEKRIAELEKEIANTPANDGACLDRDAGRRVRSIR